MGARRREKKRVPGRARLLLWVTESGKSQREISALLGISEQYMSQILAGSRGVSLPVALEIERVTGIPVRDFSGIPRRVPA